MTQGVYRYEWGLSIGFSGAIQNRSFTVGDMGFDEEEWDALSDEEREANLDSYVGEVINNYIDWSWSPKPQ